jgi:hypothetical protein
MPHAHRLRANYWLAVRVANRAFLLLPEFFFWLFVRKETRSAKIDFFAATSCGRNRQKPHKMLSRGIPGLFSCIPFLPMYYLFKILM